MKRYLCPHCYGRGGYYMPIWHNGIEVDKKWYSCPKCKDGRIKDYL
jgi:hypothetical protein